MYSDTRFSQILRALPRRFYCTLIQAHGADKHSKGFGTWDQLVTMMYAQITGADSLRTLVTGFNSQSVHHYHLGCRSVRRSTLSDANRTRDSAVFGQMCQQLLALTHRRLRSQVKELLYLLDSTPIALKG